MVLFCISAAKDTTAQIDSNGFTQPPALGFDYQLQFNHLDLSPQFWILQYKKFDAALDLHVLYYFNNTDRKGKMAAGAGVTLRYHLLKNIFAELVYQNINIPVRHSLDMSFYRAWKADIFAGVGYKQRMTNRCTAQIAALYNINYKPYSAYESRIIVKAGAYWKLK